jgi:signal transduction histidine kinase
VTWGVRGRITVVATVVVLLVLTAAGGSLIAAQRAVLTDSVDEVLQRQATTIARQVDAGRLPSSLPGQGDEEAFAQVIDDAGRVVASTSYTPSLRAPTPAAPANAAGQEATVVSARSSSNDLEYRILSEPHRAVVIRVGTPLDDVNDSVAALTRGLLVMIPAAALLLAALAWLVVGRVLRPVEAIRRQVAEIGGTSLDRRVPQPRGTDEIAELARTMNVMLDRVESAATRQRRFVADASHELRSPLARIRAELEVDRAHPESADLQATHHSVMEEAETLQSLIDDLLLLARSDGAQSLERRAPVDLDDIVMGEVARVRAGGVVTVDVSAVSGAQVLGDATQLARIVRNLLDNAARHGGPSVQVSLTEEGGTAVLSVADDGDGIPSEAHDRVFERFARMDDARSSADGGTGLGLAIARELAHAHSGDITIDAAYSPGVRFTVRLPLAAG